MTKKEWKALAVVVAIVVGSVWAHQSARESRKEGQGERWDQWQAGSPEAAKAAGASADGQLRTWKLGFWHGYEVVWVDDYDVTDKSRGFYAFKKTPGAKDKNDFDDLRRVGALGADTLFYVRDRSVKSRAPGFYALGRDGELWPMTSAGAKAGKKAIAYGALLAEESEASSLSDEALSKLGAERLEDLAQRAQRIARGKRAASADGPALK